MLVESGTNSQSLLGEPQCITAILWFQQTVQMVVVVVEEPASHTSFQPFKFSIFPAVSQKKSSQTKNLSNKIKTNYCAPLLITQKGTQYFYLHQ